MALEIERRFLVDKNKLPDLLQFDKMQIKQGYLSQPGGRSVIRARVITTSNSETSVITIKTFVSPGVSNEFEYEIPVADAKTMLESTEYIVEKTRYKIPLNDALCIELDIFENKLNGIVIAEIELDSLDEEFIIPEYLTKEITSIKGLSNFDMAYNAIDTTKLYNSLM